MEKELKIKIIEQLKKPNEYKVGDIFPYILNIAKLLKTFSGKEEIRVTILDEFVSKGRTVSGGQYLIGLVFQSMKELGEVPENTSLLMNNLVLNNEAYLGSASGWLKGREGEDDKMYSELKGGALPRHHMQRKYFEIIGEHFAKEYEILQELKKRDTVRASINK
jgi:hypothetical protein